MHGCRYSLLGEFMGHLAQTGILSRASSVLEAYLGVLKALAVTPAGAQGMFLQLHASASGPLSWRRMLDAMKQYCERYSPQQDRPVSRKTQSPE